MMAWPVLKVRSHTSSYDNRSPFRPGRNEPEILIHIYDYLTDPLKKL